MRCCITPTADHRCAGPHELVELYRWPDRSGEATVRSNFVATLDGSVQGLDGRSGSINTESDHGSSRCTAPWRM